MCLAIAELAFVNDKEKEWKRVFIFFHFLSLSRWVQQVTHLINQHPTTLHPVHTVNLSNTMVKEEQITTDESGQSGTRTQLQNVSTQYISTRVRFSHCINADCKCDECLGKVLIKGDWQEEEEEEKGNLLPNATRQRQPESVTLPQIVFTQPTRRSTRIAGFSAQIVGNNSPDSTTDGDTTDSTTTSDYIPSDDDADNNADSDPYTSYSSSYSPAGSDSNSEQGNSEREQEDTVEKINNGKRKPPLCSIIVFRLYCPVENCAEQRESKTALSEHLLAKHRIKAYPCFVAGCNQSFSNR